MDASTRRDKTRNTAVEVIRIIRATIDDEGIDLREAAAAAGIPASTFYRWLNAPPEKIDAAAIAALADWLHDEHGQEDFATLWRRVSRTLGQ